MTKTKRTIKKSGKAGTLTPARARQAVEAVSRGLERFNRGLEIEPRSNTLWEAEALIGLVGGDPEAIAALYERHSRVAYSLAYSMVGDHQTAEDLVQHAFSVVWATARSYRAEQHGSVRTWILSIVHNSGIDYLRSSASRRRTQDKVETLASASQANEAFAEAWRDSQRDQVRDALKVLPPEQLQVLELAYFSGYTHAEIADLLGIPLGTVKGRMRLGLRKIREHFHSERAHEAVTKEDPGALPLPEDGGTAMTEGRGHDDLTAAYAPGPVSGDERREFEAFLAEHPELQTEVEDLGYVAKLYEPVSHWREPS